MGLIERWRYPRGGLIERWRYPRGGPNREVGIVEHLQYVEAIYFNKFHSKMLNLATAYRVIIT